MEEFLLELPPDPLHLPGKQIFAPNRCHFSSLARSAPRRHTKYKQDLSEWFHIYQQLRFNNVMAGILEVLILEKRTLYLQFGRLLNAI